MLTTNPSSLKSVALKPPDSIMGVGDGSGSDGLQAACDGAGAYYLTAPTIPATKYFCIRKKIAAVGKVANTMPHMIMP